MTKRIIALVALIGWAAITALAWYLADARIDLCAPRRDASYARECILAATAARDTLLIICLSVGLGLSLLALLASAAATARRFRGPSSWSPASPADRPRLR
jgi:hypothetical protein